MLDWRAIAALVVLCLPAWSGQVTTAPSAALAERYAPYVESAIWAQSVTVPAELPRSWRTAAAIRAARSATALPLAGLRLVLDPGHIGGAWAADEGRQFRIAANDFWVREGELVLEVAQRAQTRLQELGATVHLVRTTTEPLNPRPPIDYLRGVVSQLGGPSDTSQAGLADYAAEIRRRAMHQAIVSDEIALRAQRINEVLQPDAVLSLHINAAPWPQAEAGQLQLVDSNHLHVLAFGCMSAAELSVPEQQQALAIKLANGSAAAEVALGRAMARALQQHTGLPAASYQTRNAMVDSAEPYLWYRNLKMLREVRCPIVMLEPYVANSKQVYPRIQTALQARAHGQDLDAADLLLEYTDAVVAGVLAAYGPQDKTGRSQ